jgi:two-component system response regulator CiaR
LKALVIEDDKRISYAICESIENMFETDRAYNGEDGLELAKQEIYDVIILDIMMPIMDGFTVIEKLRKLEILTPVLMLTAKDSSADIVKGLKMGSDDYLVKPFKTEELLARLEALIRRNRGKYIEEKTISFKNLKLNLQTREAKIDNRDLTLQGKQFDMLEYLIISKNIIVTRNQIFNKIWGFNSFATTNVVDVYASFIRKELKKYRL